MHNGLVLLLNMFVLTTKESKQMEGFQVSLYFYMNKIIRDTNIFPGYINVNQQVIVVCYTYNIALVANTEDKFQDLLHKLNFSCA